MAESLSPFHQTQLENFLRFARFKRDQQLRDVDLTFAEAKETRLRGDETYSAEDVKNILNGVAAVIKKDVQRELMYSAHSTSVLLRAIFAQAEEVKLGLYAEVTNMENERLLKEVASFDTLSIQKDKDPTSKLPSLAKVQDPNLKQNMETVSAQNTSLKAMIEKLQKEVETLKAQQPKVETQTITQTVTQTVVDTAETEKMKKQMEDMSLEMKQNSSKLENELQQSQQQQKQQSEQLQAKINQLEDSEKKAKEEIETMKEKLVATEKKLQKTSQELEVKIRKTTQFLALKKMMVQKNTQMKQLREILLKYDPNAAASIDVDDKALTALEDD